MSESTSLEKAQALINRVHGDNVIQLAAEIEREEKQRAEWQARVDRLPELEQQRAELHQALGDLTKEVEAAIRQQHTLAEMRQQLLLLDDQILSTKNLAASMQ